MSWMLILNLRADERRGGGFIAAMKAWCKVWGGGGEAEHVSPDEKKIYFIHFPKYENVLPITWKWKVLKEWHWKCTHTLNKYRERLGFDRSNVQFGSDHQSDTLFCDQSVGEYGSQYIAVLMALGNDRKASRRCCQYKTKDRINLL